LFLSALRPPPGSTLFPYTTLFRSADAVAGLVVGVVALPLSMALAIAAGAPPEHGLYTAIVAGMVIALTGGSMHSVSGPTAAFVRSEEHTSELQSRENLVCRLLLEK